ncbi:MAG: hypothetical protein II161_03520, partial [Erysipelotrichaceae bacterium]|nr:hypothetical protein [Erysipelotrichaceae bacterium]
KLMCCLKFEDESYKQMRKGLPKLNSAIEYDGVRYRITSINLLNESVHLANRESSVDITLTDLRKILKLKEEKETVEK